MSVYTSISRADLSAFLERYALGGLVRHDGITAGIENTNYIVETTGGRYVLTVFERTAASELPFCLDLMAYLADRGIPSPHPVADGAGRYLQVLRGKPTVIVHFLDGASIEAPRRAHCSAVGTMMARMHETGNGFHDTRPTDRGREWRDATAARVRPHLDRAQQRLLDDTVGDVNAFDDAALPRGAIHADLFRDNVLFDGERIGGFIDFYYAHTGALIYDVAVAFADWCFVPDGRLDEARASAFLDAYAATRAPTRAEIDAWPACVRAAALRFWLSRLNDRLFPRDGELTHSKDPGDFEALLRFAIADEHALESLWR